jgi:hypothetical protein
MVGSGADPGLKLFEWSFWIHSSVPLLAEWNNQLFMYTAPLIDFE